MTGKNDWIPMDLSMKADRIKKNAKLNHKTDAFSLMGNMQPTIIGEESIRLPKSKDIIKHIDVRYTFKMRK